MPNLENTLNKINSFNDDNNLKIRIQKGSL